MVTSEYYNYYCSNANILRPPSLPALTSTLSNKEMLRSLLDYNVLTEVVRWITPHSGKLGNVTIRRDLLRAVGNMKGESGINSSDLKKSQIGRLVMQLYSCSAETNDMKAIHKGLIDAWSRPIFKKSGNYRDLAEVEVARREKGWEPKNMRKRPRAANDSSRSRFLSPQPPSPFGASGSGSGSRDDDKISSILTGKVLRAKVNTKDRVRVPMSKGFSFSIRPQDRVVDEEGKGGA